jgi:hypothetical protein
MKSSDRRYPGSGITIVDECARTTFSLIPACRQAGSVEAASEGTLLGESPWRPARLTIPVSRYAPLKPLKCCPCAFLMVDSAASGYEALCATPLNRFCLRQQLFILDK